MKTIQFTALATVQGNTYAPTQIVAFGDDALADSIVTSGDAIAADEATVFVEHIDRTEPQP